MENFNRDLLLLFNQELMSPQAIENEVEFLHGLLYDVERIESLVIAHELFDLNRYRIIRKTPHLRNFFRNRELKPFEFLNCKN
jgi:hypothetical protein